MVFWGPCTLETCSVFLSFDSAAYLKDAFWLISTLYVLCSSQGTAFALPITLKMMPSSKRSLMHRASVFRANHLVGSTVQVHAYTFHTERSTWTKQHSSVNVYSPNEQPKVQSISLNWRLPAIPTFTLCILTHNPYLTASSSSRLLCHTSGPLFVYHLSLEHPYHFLHLDCTCPIWNLSEEVLSYHCSVHVSLHCTSMEPWATMAHHSLCHNTLPAHMFPFSTWLRDAWDKVPKILLEILATTIVLATIICGQSILFFPPKSKKK